MAEPASEQSDVDVRGVLVGGAMITTAIGAALAVAWMLASGHGRGPLQRPEIQRDAPLLHPHPERALARYRAAQRAKVHGYAWIDRQAGIVRIPIDRAMELIAQEHARDAAPADGEATTP